MPGRGNDGGRPGESPEPSKLPEIAYAESTRAIQEQQAVLDNLRTRAGTVFASGSVAVAFLAGIGLEDRGMPWQAWVGVGLYVVLLALTSWVVYPIKKLTFAMSAAVLLDDSGCDDAWVGRSNDEVHSALALELEGHHDTNAAKIDRRFGGLQAAVVTLGLDIAVWIVVLAWR